MWIVGTHQSAHGAVKSMPVVPSELGVGALERGVTVRLGLFDTAQPPRQSLHLHSTFRERWGENVPVPVVLLRLVMLGRVLGFCTSESVTTQQHHTRGFDVLAIATVVCVDSSGWCSWRLIDHGVVDFGRAGVARLQLQTALVFLGIGSRCRHLKDITHVCDTSGYALLELTRCHLIQIHNLFVSS